MFTYLGSFLYGCFFIGGPTPGNPEIFCYLRISHIFTTENPAPISARPTCLNARGVPCVTPIREHSDATLIFLVVNPIYRLTSHGKYGMISYKFSIRGGSMCGNGLHVEPLTPVLKLKTHNAVKGFHV